MKTSLFFVLLLSSCSLLWSQAGTLNEEQISAEGLFLAAKQAALLGNTDEAIQQFEAIAKSNPENSVVFFELGRLYHAKEDFNTAIEKLVKAYELEPQDFYAYFLTDVYESSGRYREGAQLLGQLVRQYPDEVDLYLQQADFLVRGQQADKAIDVYEKLEDQIGINALVTRRKHAIYLQQDDQRKAERELTRLVDAYPDRMEYRHLLAGYYQSQDQQTKLKQVYQDILRISPNDVRAQLALQSATPNAASNNELMQLISRPDVDIDLKIGRLLGLVQEVLDSGDPAKTAEVTQLAEELQRVHSDEAKAAALLGDMYAIGDRYADAATAYAQALELEESIYTVWEQYLMVLYQDQQLAELRDAGQDAIDIFPNRPLLYVYQALAEASRADYSEANSLLQQAQLMSGGKVELVQQVAAAQALVQVLENTPTTASPTLSSATDPLAIVLSGREAFNNGDYQAVADQLSAARHDRLSNALLLELLADAQVELGQNEAARTNYERAKAAGSKSRELPAKLRAISGK